AGEVAVGLAPVGDGPGDAVHELADARLALRRVHLAVEVLADDDIGGELAPGPGDLAAGLLEDDPAALVLDGRGALLPLDLVEGADALGAEASRHDHPPARAAVVPPLPGRF